MEKGRPLLRWAGILLVFAAVSFMGNEVRGDAGPVKTPEPGRSDRLTIDTLAAFQKLELPPVTFFHDKHTDALLKEKKGCETCHLVEDNQLSLTFLRKKGTKPAEIKDIYHKGCIGCHMETAAAGKPSGPPDGLCRSCHDAEPKVAVSRLPAGLEKVLHYRHVDSKSIPAKAPAKDNCAACHHEYDQKAKKIYYAKGHESNCGYCHLAKPQAGVKSLEQAAHQQCVLCHLDLANKGVKEPVPVRCDDCHGAKAQAQTAKNNRAVAAKLKDPNVLRINRGQPNATMITYDPKFEDKPVKPLLMNPVPFDHQSHEKYTDSCQVCHHASLDACGKCHTLAGSKDGKGVTFEQAMHSKTSKHSCIGCHNAQQAAANCQGCHRGLTAARKSDDASCRQCHTAVPGITGKDVISPPQKAGMAETLLKKRTPTLTTYPVEDIPEKVVIKELMDQYKPVEMNHRQHVQKLMAGLKDSKLAQYFHGDPGTVCQGCHHNSPPSKNPPRCANCHPQAHGQALTTVEATRPGLLAAQHGQCMNCHKVMAVKPEATACTECHKERKK